MLTPIVCIFQLSCHFLIVLLRHNCIFFSNGNFCLQLFLLASINFQLNHINITSVEAWLLLIQVISSAGVIIFFFFIFLFTATLEPTYRQLQTMRLDKSPFVIISVIGQELLAAGHYSAAVVVLEAALKIGTCSLKLRGSVFSALSSAYWALNSLDKVSRSNLVSIGIIFTIL